MPTNRDPSPPAGQILIYEDGATHLQVRLDGQTVWLTQAEIARLYQTTPQNITLHLKSIFDDAELDEQASCKEYLQVRREGTRDVQRSLKHYNLDAILALPETLTPNPSPSGRGGFPRPKTSHPSPGGRGTEAEGLEWLNASNPRTTEGEGFGRHGSSIRGIQHE